MGQKRRFRDVRCWSDMPPLALMKAGMLLGSRVPAVDIRDGGFATARLRAGQSGNFQSLAEPRHKGRSKWPRLSRVRNS